MICHDDKLFQVMILTYSVLCMHLRYVTSSIHNTMTGPMLRCYSSVMFKHHLQKDWYEKPEQYHSKHLEENVTIKWATLSPDAVLLGSLDGT